MKFFILFLPVLILYFLLSTSMLLTYPPIWPDESYLADVASNINKSQKYGLIILTLVAIVFDNTFLKASRLGRTEILVILSGTLIILNLIIKLSWKSQLSFVPIVS